MNFYSELNENLLRETKNHFVDNYDFMSHGININTKKKLALKVKSLIFSPFIFKYFTSKKIVFEKLILERILKMNSYMEGISKMYDRLADENSRQLLIKIVSFRIMGNEKVKLPYHSDTYWSDLDKLKSNRDEENFITLNFKPWKLYYHDLNPYNLDIKLFYTTHRTYAALIREHYKYKGDEVIIDVDDGDIVLDLGGCYGDTALYFSNKVGVSGKVYSFEFIPGSIDIFNTNLELNKALKDTVAIVDKPLWNESGKKVYFQDQGGASRVSFDEFEGMEGMTMTTTIDQFVKEQNLAGVDFIKTDIEGAEPFVLEGSIETIKNFKPKLAISIYHNLDDFTGIINQIDSLNLGYKFYLGHASIYASETVLFCKA